MIEQQEWEVEDTVRPPEKPSGSLKIYEEFICIGVGPQEVLAEAKRLQPGSAEWQQSSQVQLSSRTLFS